MQFPESWLREFCNPPISTDELADLLTMAGLEVEEMRAVAPPFQRRRGRRDRRGRAASERRQAARLQGRRGRGVARRPAADRLRRAQRARGHPRAAGDGGRELPPAEEGGKPFKIGVGKLRGVDSYGMLCSARELKLADDHGGLLELPLDTPSVSTSATR
jgi:phenylalanyl-tRNA synthetase beta chain